MNASKNHQNTIRHIADNTLALFTAVSNFANLRLKKPDSISPSVIANLNTLNSVNAIKSIESINDEARSGLQVLAREPAIARIVTEREDGTKNIYFICRGAPAGARMNGAALASYRAPVGRLASIPVGDEFELGTPAGTVLLKVLERAELHPTQVDAEWDSRNSKLQGHEYGTLTVLSFRALLDRDGEHAEDTTVLESLLAEEAASSNIIEGIRRNVITNMGLRDQAVLDQYQDEIFRLPLDSKLLILGPPGSGKTTTLIRRLGQKLDVEFLDENERGEVERATINGAPEHEASWIMFTPTELLKQYLKEAFAREDIAASDERISTWADYGRDLARHKFNILRTSTGGGSFVLRETLNTIQDSTIQNQIEWFEDFQAWQSAIFCEELIAAALYLGESKEPAIAVLGRQLTDIAKDASTISFATTFLSIEGNSEKVQALITSKKAETDGRIGRALNLQVNRDRSFLDALAKLMDGLTELDEDPDDPELDDDEEMARPRTGRAAAAAAYSSTMRALARAQISRRPLLRTSRSGRIAEWIGNRSLSPDELGAIGQSLQIQSAARIFLNPIRRYINGIPSRYRRFRRIRQTEGKWYRPDGYAPNDAAPLEIDVILLGILRSAGELLQERRIFQNVDDQRYSSLKAILDLARNQVMVDEVTDFSPIQVACMGAISNPRINSFFACGDFNQRITEWGSRSDSEMRWAIPGIDIRSIVITYRHSKQLSDLAKEIVRLCGGVASDVLLPKDVNSDGVSPVLAKGLGERSTLVNWLTQRIIEIERFTDELPSIAVLVNAAEDVGPLADALNEALVTQNIRAVACHNGQTVGQEIDVRIFDIQHIKGLEFEAVFFVGIDELAKMNPALFDKYLYVGATRAATYLGITCAGDSLPQKIAAIEPRFVANWIG